MGFIRSALESASAASAAANTWKHPIHQPIWPLACILGGTWRPFARHFGHLRVGLWAGLWAGRRSYLPLLFSPPRRFPSPLFPSSHGIRCYGAAKKVCSRWSASWKRHYMKKWCWQVSTNWSKVCRTPIGTVLTSNWKQTWYNGKISLLSLPQQNRFTKYLLFLAEKPWSPKGMSIKKIPYRMEKDFG